MFKKQLVQTVINSDKSTVCIIGNDSAVAGYLLRKLEEQGCQVTLRSWHETISARRLPADYIFQFDRFQSMSTALKTFGHSNTKLLFIDTQGVDFPTQLPNKNIRLLRVGSLTDWDVSDICSKFLSTLFAVSAVPFQDIRKKKKAVLPFSEIPPVAPSTIPVTKRSKPQLFPAKISQENASAVFAKPHISKRFTLWTSTIFFVLLISASLTAYYVASWKRAADNLRTHVATGDFTAAGEDVSFMKKKIAVVKGIHTILSPLLVPFQRVPWVKDVETILTVSDSVVTELTDSIAFLKRVRATTFSSTNTYPVVSKSVLAETSQTLVRLRKVLDTTQTSLATLTFPVFPKQELLQHIKTTHESLATAQELLPLAEQVLTAEGRKTYLLLFQNNMELRPTGGFIGSIGILNVNNGAVSEFRIMDVYDADGQLKGHVEPPTPIRTYLNQPNWFLRDSNFDPDFAISAQKAIWFLQKELGLASDGAIGINLYVAQNLLRLTGPLKLADFPSEHITAENFILKAQQYSQDEFFPGSRQKRNFLSAVAKSMQQAIFTNSLPTLGFLNTVKTALDEKNIQLYFSQPSSQTFVENNGWAGRMASIGCTSQTSISSSPSGLDACIPDYLAIIEANLGVNKVNYFIDKTVSIDKKINTTGNMITAVAITYKNQSVENVLNGGTYTNYLRVLAPKGATLINVVSDGSPLAPDDVHVEPYSEDKTSFGALVNVGVQKMHTVTIAFASSQIFTNNTRSYQLFYQKQPGDKLAPVSIMLTYPSGVTFTPVNFVPHQKEPTRVQYTTDSSVDRIFSYSIENTPSQHSRVMK